MKPNKKSVLHEFDPLIYPRKLWVTIGTDKFPDVFDEVCDWDESAYAITSNVHDKVNDRGGILIRFQNKSAMTADVITHEATHAAMEIFDYIGAQIDLKNQEVFSYLCGWIAKCIAQVKNHKV